jgi:hypothetical protein
MDEAAIEAVLCGRKEATKVAIIATLRILRFMVRRVPKSPRCSRLKI